MLTLPDHRDVIAARVRSAFATGDLGAEDYYRFDSRRGYMQYNDCLVLQMLSNPEPSRPERALAPKLFHNDAWVGQCSLLRELIEEKVDPKSLRLLRYVNYWHGYNAVAAFALQSMELRTLRRMIVGAVWAAIGLLALVAWRSGRYVRRTGVTIALTAATVWAVPYFSPGLTQGPGDALLILGLAGLAAWPQMAVRPAALVPYAAGFGAVVGFFEMMTGQYPVAAAWLAALALAARRDRGRPENGSVSTTALVAVAVVLRRGRCDDGREACPGGLAHRASGRRRDLPRSSPPLHGCAKVRRKPARIIAAVPPADAEVENAQLRKKLGRLRPDRRLGSRLARGCDPGMAGASHRAWPGRAAARRCRPDPGRMGIRPAPAHEHARAVHGSHSRHTDLARAAGADLAAARRESQPARWRPQRESNPCSGLRGFGGRKAPAKGSQPCPDTADQRARSAKAMCLRRSPPGRTGVSGSPSPPKSRRKSRCGGSAP